MLAPGTGAPLAAAGWRNCVPSAGLAEKLFAGVLAAFVALRLLAAPTSVLLLASVAVAGIGAWVAVRFLRHFLRLLIWRLRNRLIVAFLFIAVIPILLVLLLAAYGAREISGQIAVYLVHSEMDRRLNSLRGTASTLSRVEEAMLPAAMDRIGGFQQERFPGLQITVRTADRAMTFPSGSAPVDQPVKGERHGLLVKEETLHAWAHAGPPGREVTILAPLTRHFFSDLVPDLGEISVLHFPAPPAPRRTIRFHPLPSREEEEAAAQSLPPAEHRFDFELLWGTRVPVSFWDRPEAVEVALLGVHSRLSSVVRILFSQKTESGVLPLLYGLAILILVVEVASLLIGISITRTITGAVDNLYEGTQRVMEGDFSHRIQVHGNEQIAGLSQSFNRMTENVERLLVVAKENERIQAELKIARDVQAQLFPTSEPRLSRLDLKAVCHPARTVSGDYYDYQTLSDGRIAIAVADVAGKGISAALLMASLQSTLRAELRTWQGGQCPARLMSVINHQLYLNTAPEKYATFFFAVFDDATGTLTYTNAGHLPPFLIRGAEIQPLDVNGTVVGVFPGSQYTESNITLQPGDLLVCYTDGVTETENEFGEMFGDHRFADVLRKNAAASPEQLITSVAEAVTAFTGSLEPQDDLTLLVARRR